MENESGNRPRRPEARKLSQEFDDMDVVDQPKRARPSDVDFRKEGGAGGISTGKSKSQDQDGNDADEDAHAYIKRIR